MITKDLTLFESGDGGELYLKSNKDLSLSEKIFQTAYIRLFGGNVEASTKGDELPTQIRNDWWGNSLFFKEKPQKQFNSETEKTLSSVALNSYGRMAILRAVEEDLKFLREISDIQINVVLLSVQRLSIELKINQPNNIEGKPYKIIWDNAKQEVITEINI